MHLTLRWPPTAAGRQHPPWASSMGPQPAAPWSEGLPSRPTMRLAGRHSGPPQLGPLEKVALRDEAPNFIVGHTQAGSLPPPQPE